MVVRWGDGEPLAQLSPGNTWKTCDEIEVGNYACVGFRTSETDCLLPSGSWPLPPAAIFGLPSSNVKYEAASQNNQHIVNCEQESQAHRTRQNFLLYIFYLTEIKLTLFLGLVVEFAF